MKCANCGKKKGILNGYCHNCLLLAAYHLIEQDHELLKELSK